MRFGAKGFEKLEQDSYEWIFPTSSDMESQRLLAKLNSVADVNDYVAFSERIAGFPDELHAVEEINGFIEDIHARLAEVLSNLDIASAKSAQKTHLLVLEDHHRAAWTSLPKPVMDDTREIIRGRFVQNPEVYNYLNIKGLGYVFPETFESKKDNFKGNVHQPTVGFYETSEFPWNYNVLGLADKRVLEPILKHTQIMQRLGGRVEKIVAAAQLKQIYFEGKLIPVDDLKKQGVIPSENFDGKPFEPVQIFRLQRVPYRINDLYKADKIHKLAMLRESFEALNRENRVKGDARQYSLNDMESVKSYIKDSVYWIGRNLGLMQGAAYTYGYFNSGNITLGLGELVDIDSMKPLKVDPDNKEVTVYVKNSPDSYKYKCPPVMGKDIRDGIYSIRRFLIAINSCIPVVDAAFKQETAECFLQGYQEGRKRSNALDNGAYKDIEADNVLEMVADLAHKMIIEDRNVRPVVV